MGIREIAEAVQLVNTAGTEQKVYESPAGEVLIIHKAVAINTDTTANAVIDCWLDQDGGSSVAKGDVSHFTVNETLSAGQELNLKMAGMRLAAGGQFYADIAAAGGGNFQSAVNIHVSGVLVGQSRAATGTSA